MLDDLICRSSEIGVSCFTGTQAGQGARILKRAKELNPGIVTGVGGFHARFNPEATLAEPSSTGSGRNDPMARSSSPTTSEPTSTSFVVT